MNYKQLLVLLSVFLLNSCKQEYHLTKIEASRLEISDSLQTDDSLDAFVKPFREHINKDMDNVLAYAVDTYSKTDGELNTAIGNFMADLILEQATPIYKARTDHSIDMVLLNHGGIRAIISKGQLTTRTAFEIMPFENSIVVIEMKGKLIQDELIPYLLNTKRAHPISNLKLLVDKDYKLIEASINNESIIDDQTYYVATNDYLYYGGDNMTFFQKGENMMVLDYKIRNAIIDYLIKVDTVSPTIDDRFIKTN